MGKKQLTTEEFIRRAREIHGDKYDYSKVEYKGIHTKVCIICPEHGEFWQTPSAHIYQKQECPKCVNNNIPLTTEEFIRRAKEIHGDKYDYSKAVYKSSFEKVCIICPEHGEFWQTPSAHIKQKQECPKCAKTNRLETTNKKGLEKFIKDARKVHGDKYDYSKVIYNGINRNVCIICPEHGEFWQTPYNHTNKKCECPKCSGNARLTTEEFIRRAKEIHGDKYDYSKVEFISVNKKVCVICPEHGEFWVRASHFLGGHGCPNCAGLRKEYKFNLLQEFENEYSFKSFLENNDENILYVILRNIEPKYDPIKKDIEKALDRSFNENPIKALEEKYSSDSDDEIDDDESWAESETDEAPVIDLDDDEAVEAMLSSDGDAEVVQAEPTIEDLIKNTEKEIKVINKIEHLLTPEDREYIMEKFLNDKRRAWMLKREERI